MSTDRIQKQRWIDEHHPLLKIVALLVIISPIILYFSISPLVFANAPNEKTPWVSWWGNPQNEVYVSWETEEETLGRVNYGTEKDELTTSVVESEKAKIHHLNISGLTADTKYYYEVEIEGDVFGNGEFRTAPTGYDDFSWVMFSDTQQNVGPGHNYRLANALADKTYAFAADVGDIGEDGGEKKYYNHFFASASKYLDTNPFIPVIGNHDDRGETRWFNEYFINEMNSSTNQFYWSFNWSSVHFQICHFPYGREPEMTDHQLAWIKQDLANAQDMPFRVVMFHCPIIAGGFFGRSEDLLDQVLPIMKDYDVSLTVHGHEHHYERGYLGDVAYMVLGGGGGALDIGLQPQPETDFMTASPCYTEVDATDDTLTLKTYTLQEELIDQFELEADGGN